MENTVNLTILDYRQDAGAVDNFRIVPSNAGVIITDRATAETELSKAIKDEDYPAIDNVLKAAELTLSADELRAMYDSVNGLPDSNKQWFRRNYGNPVVSVIKDMYGVEKPHVTTGYSGGGEGENG